MSSIDILNSSITGSEQIISEIGRVGNILEAIGFIAILWIAFQVSNWYANRKRLKEISLLREDIQRIEEKISKIQQ